MNNTTFSSSLAKQMKFLLVLLLLVFLENTERKKLSDKNSLRVTSNQSPGTWTQSPLKSVERFLPTSMGLAQTHTNALLAGVSLHVSF